MNGQLVYVLIAGLILVVNTFLLFWLRDVRSDIRELRQNYLSALKEVADLKIEIANLRSEIATLRTELAKEKEKHG